MGKEYDAYGLTQKQRQMETAMRAQREKVDLLKEAGVDPDEITIARAKYQAQLDKYSRFCRKMGLKEQRERIYMDMRGFVATNTKAQNAKYSPEMLRNADKYSKEFKKYKNILGRDVGLLADFRQMKYNNTKKYELFKIYAGSVENGAISRLSDFENYYKLYNAVENQIIGIETSEGLVVSGQSKHFMERVIGTMYDSKNGRPRSGVSIDAMLDALLNPVSVRPVKTDKKGKKSQKYVGKTATISINPETGSLIQCNPTDSDLLRRLQSEKV